MEVKGRFDHFNFNVLDLDRSIRFYEKALGLKEVRRMEAPDGFFYFSVYGRREDWFSVGVNLVEGSQGTL